MRAFEILKDDHAKVKKIFETLEPTTTQALKTRAELFNKLKQELEAHTTMEEKYFYPLLEDEDETEEIAEHAVDEHQEVKDLLKEIASLKVDSDEWLPKVLELKESVEHHVREEESEMFKKAKEVLTSEQLEEVAVNFETQKKKVAAAARK